jgi:hypothetical protein
MEQGNWRLEERKGQAELAEEGMAESCRRDDPNEKRRIVLRCAAVSIAFST